MTKKWTLQIERRIKKTEKKTEQGNGNRLQDRYRRIQGQTRRRTQRKRRGEQERKRERERKNR